MSGYPELTDGDIGLLIALMLAMIARNVPEHIVCLIVVDAFACATIPQSVIERFKAKCELAKSEEALHGWTWENVVRGVTVELQQVIVEERRKLEA